MSISTTHNIQSHLDQLRRKHKKFLNSKTAQPPHKPVQIYFIKIARRTTCIQRSSDNHKWLWIVKSVQFWWSNAFSVCCEKKSSEAKGFLTRWRGEKEVVVMARGQSFTLFYVRHASDMK